MKQRSKTIYFLLLVAVLLLPVYGCKKTDNSIRSLIASLSDDDNYEHASDILVSRASEAEPELRMALKNMVPDSKEYYRITLILKRIEENKRLEIARKASLGKKRKKTPVYFKVIYVDEPSKPKKTPFKKKPAPSPKIYEPKVYAPKDWFRETGAVRIPSSGGRSDWIVGFNNFNVPRNITVGQSVQGKADMVFDDENGDDAGAVTYISIFGDWDPGRELARIYYGLFGSSPRTVSRTFNFVAPSKPGQYHLRCAITLAFAPVRNFYGTKPKGQRDPGVGPYSEISFRVR